MPVRIKQLLIAVAAALILAVAFAGYLQPAFVVDLANRIILCF